MKYDANAKPNKATRRTLLAFSTTLITLLEEHSLENITINMLCEACDYPRATFYNHFEDIYDLLEYCFSVIQVDMDMDRFMEVPEGNRTLFLFGIFYDYLKSQWGWLEKVLEVNPMDGKCVESLRKYIRRQIAAFMETAISASPGRDFPLSRETMVSHYSNTIELVLTRCFISGENYSREDAMKAVDFLLGSVERRAALMAPR